MIFMLFLIRWYRSKYNGDAVKISPSESFYGRFPNTTVAEVHAIGHDGSSAATATALFAHYWMT